jgi:hypothetical protein
MSQLLENWAIDLGAKASHARRGPYKSGGLFGSGRFSFCLFVIPARLTLPGARGIPESGTLRAAATREGDRKDCVVYVDTAKNAHYGLFGLTSLRNRGIALLSDRYLPND